jgi:hypothetical protein
MVLVHHIHAGTAIVRTARPAAAWLRCGQPETDAFDGA